MHHRSPAEVIGEPRGGFPSRDVRAVDTDSGFDSGAYISYTYLNIRHCKVCNTKSDILSI